MPTTKAKAVKEVKAVEEVKKPSKAEEARAKGLYKDSYAVKPTESKEAFLAIKLKRETSKFTLLYRLLEGTVKKNVKEAAVDIKSIGVEYVDPRLPRYVLDFLPGGKEYFVREPKVKELTKNDNSGGKTSGLVGFTIVKK